MARDATERVQSRRLTLDMKEQGRRIITHEEFLAQCRENPDELFDFVADTFNGMIDLENEYREKIDEEFVQNLQNQLQEHKERLKDKEDQIDELMAERDEYKTAYAEAQLRFRGSTVESTKSSGKSEKVPDPPLLTDGKEPKFEDWMIEMKGKFVANADRFDNDQMKRVYLVSRTGGLARQQLSVRLREDATDPYTSVEQMFKTLTTAFRNPHRRMEADAELQTLYMHPGDKFPEFLAKFLLLASEAGIPDDRYKIELNRRLTDKVKELSLPYIGDDKTFDEFTAYVGTVVQSLNANSQEAKRRNLRGNPRNNPNGNPSKSTNNPGNTQLDNNTRQELMIQGKCFHCKEAGHVFRDCPRRKKNSNAAQLRKIETVPETLNNNPGNGDA
jgi:ribosome-associated translation inhibitor RaiA